MGSGALGLVAFAVAVALAVGTFFLAAAARPAERGWGTGRAGRLERLGRPAWANRGGPQGGKEGGKGGGRGRSGVRTRVQGLGPGVCPLGEGWSWVLTVVGWLAVAVAGAVAGHLLLGGPVGGVVSAVGAAWAWQARRNGIRAASRRRFQEELEGLLETMVASLRAGRGLVRAMEDASNQAGEPLSGILGGAVAAHRAGKPLGLVLAQMAEEWPSAEAAYLGACLQTHLRTGGDVTALLINLGGLVRERRRLARDLAARTGEARATAALLALLPPALLAYILWVEPSQLAPLFDSRFGRAALAIAAGCWAAGVLVIRRMLVALGREIGEEG